MLIDEAKGQLRVYGAFGQTQGKVWVDSAELPILSWSDTIITAIISAFGRGSSGPVSIEVGGNQSNVRVLSSWAMDIETLRRHIMSNGKEDGSASKLKLRWRYDIHSALIKKSLETVGSFSSSVATLYGGTDWWNSCGSTIPVANIDSFLTSISLSYQNHKFVLPSMNSEVLFDTDFTILNKSVSTWDRGYFINDSWEVIENSFLPPMRAVALYKNPSIIAPKNNTSNTGTSQLWLQWYALNLMDSYRLQIAFDSTFTAFFLDTSTSNLLYSLKGLDKNAAYYWRVAGLNSEGQSRWSPIWHFTTGVNADVGNTFSAASQLEVYPNPATNKININYQIGTSEISSIKLYDLLGREVCTLAMGFTESGTHSTTIETTSLSAGNYILVVESGSERLSKLVSISRF